MTVNGDRIRQAREIRGLTQAELAESIGVNQSTVARLEANAIESPEEVHLQAIALRTGFPSSFFRQPTSPDFPLGSLLFRKRRTLTSLDKARIRQLAGLIYELAEKMAPPKQFGIGIQKFSGAAEQAARAMRDSLGLSPDSPILRLVSLLERNGVLVLALPISIPKYDAFSLWSDGDPRRPVIVLSANKSGDRQRFSLSHELGHIVMHHPLAVGNANVEQEANTFASAFLLPEDAMRREMLPPLTLTTLAELKSRWGVSIQALIMRAFSLALLSRRQVAQRFKWLSAQGWRAKEPIEIPAEKPRLFRKRAEIRFGPDFDPQKVAELVHAPVKLIEEVLQMHASRDDLAIAASESGAVRRVRDTSAVRSGKTRIVYLSDRRARRRS